MAINWLASKPVLPEYAKTIEMRCRNSQSRLLFLVVFPFFLEAQVTAIAQEPLSCAGSAHHAGRKWAPDFNGSIIPAGDCQLTGETESVWLYFSFQ